MVHEIAWGVPPVHRSPPDGATIVTAGGDATMRLEKEKERGHAARRLPGSESSSAPQPIVTEYVVGFARGAVGRRVRTVLDASHEAVAGTAGATATAASASERFMGSLNVRTISVDGSMSDAPSDGWVAMRTGRVESIVKKPSLVSQADNPPESMTQTRMSAAVVSTEGRAHV